MIIVDFSQVILANLYMQIGSNAKGEVQEDMLRHMILTSFRSYKRKFGAEYGQMVLACDSRAYWRRTVFPYYKASRKTSRDESGLDWDAIFTSLHKIRQEIKDHLPWIVIDVEGAEADDVIGALCNKLGTDMMLPTSEKILIISGDKDFIQLQTYANVQQWSPVKKKMITHPSPTLYLREHIIRGDVGDGVPNMLSADDCFIIKTRQTPVSSKKLEEWIKTEVPSKVEQDTVAARNWFRNKQLIDLSMIPMALQDEIYESYLAQKNKKPNQLFNYFIDKQLKYLMNDISDFQS